VRQTAPTRTGRCAVSATRIFSSERLKAERERAGYTRADVAVAVCRSWGAIYQFETGLLTPGASVIVAMADLFDCPIDSFYTEDESA
jgi:DNA-binding XRE family transcriptional regulator